MTGVTMSDLRPRSSRLRLSSRRAPLARQDPSARMTARRGLAFILWTAAVLAPIRLQAAEPLVPIVLSPSQQAAIARAFAPIMVSHPLERYFPASSMEPVAGRLRPEAWPDRVAEYQGLSQADKLNRASVGYRVFSRVHRGRTEVIAEYWFYYVYNAFTVRGGWLPYRVPVNHPHDLERVYVVLTSTQMASESDRVIDEVWAREAFRVRSVVANAHDGSIPPNQYDVPDHETLAAPITLLVERGSHAMAPDVNHDGIFTPGVDSTSRLKLQWGIRDTGATWGWYRASFMEPRGATALRLCGPAAAAADRCGRYALYLADDLQRWFGEFQLTSSDRHDIVGRLSWWVRAFGDIRIEDLLVPKDLPDGRVLDEMRSRPTNTEAGFLTGVMVGGGPPAFMLGRRAFWDVPSRRAPDVGAEAIALFPARGRTEFEATVWTSYSVDAITNVVLGAGWFSRTGSADIVAGVDLRIGRFRVRPTWKLRTGGFASRVTLLF